MSVLNPSQVNDRIRAFKSELRSATPIEMVRRHVMYGSCATLADAAYLDIKAEIARNFEVHPNEVLILGSSKLGFSIAPKKLYRHFADTSDIDVVIVSSALFDSFWRALHLYSVNGGYWPKAPEFKEYMFNGWMRPDKLPPTQTFEQARKWWDLFEAMTQSGKYSAIKIVGALYRDWYFLESYQLKGVNACLSQLQGEDRQE